MKPTFMAAAWNLLNAANMISLIPGTCGICFYGWIMRLDEQTRVAHMEYTWNYLRLLLVCLAIFIWANSIKIGRFKVDKPLWTFVFKKKWFWFLSLGQYHKTICDKGYANFDNYFFNFQKSFLKNIEFLGFFKKNLFSLKNHLGYWKEHSELN